MFLVSKTIRDPTDGLFPKRNGMGRTVGVVLRTPKFWDCQTYDFDTSQFDTMNDGPLSERQMSERYEQKAAHRGCKRKHLSYRGYVYWIGPARRIDFRFMGPTHTRQRWWKPVTIAKHGMYVRWLDNGPQNPPPDESIRKAANSPAMQEHRRQFVATLEASRAQMIEYTARRDAEENA